MAPDVQAAHDRLDELGGAHLYTKAGTSGAVRRARASTRNENETADLDRIERALAQAGHLLASSYEH